MHSNKYKRVFPFWKSKACYPHHTRDSLTGGQKTHREKVCELNLLWRSPGLPRLPRKASSGNIPGPSSAKGRELGNTVQCWPQF